MSGFTGFNSGGGGGGSGVVGPGTVNKLAKFTAATTVLDSSISDSGVLVSVANAATVINQASATKAFIVQGAAVQTANLFELQDSTSATLAEFSSAGSLGIGVAPGAYKLNVAGAVRVGGKLTVTGGIDPTYLELASGATNDVYINFTDGATVPSAIVGQGRIRYVAGSNLFQVSGNGGIFYTFASGGSGSVISASVPLVVTTGNITLGTAAAPTTVDANADVIWGSSAVGKKPLVLQGKALQTANLLESQDSTGAVLGFMSATGAFGAKSAALSSVATNDVFLNMTDGQTVALSAVNEGRIRYNANAGVQNFQVSVNGGAYATLLAGVPTLSAVLAAGNTSGANNILMTTGQQLDAATAAAVLNLGNTNASALGIGTAMGTTSTFQVFINQGGASFSSNAGVQLSSTTSNRGAYRANQFGNNAGVPGITGFKSRGTNVGDLASVLDGDVLWRGTAIGVAGDNASVPLAGFVSIQVPTGGSVPLQNWVATDFSVSLVKLTGPINSVRQVFRITSEAALELIDGTTAAVSPAGKGQIRYNNGTPIFEYSVNGGAWTAFGTVGGSGTAGKLPKWSAASTLTDSIITETAGSLSAATTYGPFQVGAVDALGRPQIWWYPNNAGNFGLLRLGSDASDGDPAGNVDSSGIVIWEPSIDRGSRIKSNRFGLTQSSASANYYFRVDDAKLFYCTTPGGADYSIYINKTTRFVGLGGISAPVGAELFRATGGTTLHDFTSTTAFKVTQTGGGTPALVVDTMNTRVGIGAAPGAFTLDIAGSVSVSGAAANAYTNFVTSTAAVSAAGEGRLRYVNGTPAFEVSVNGGAYSALLTAASLGTTAFLQNGNAFGGLATLGTTDANALRIITNTTEHMRVLSTGQVLVHTAIQIDPELKAQFQVEALSDGSQSGIYVHGADYQLQCDTESGSATVMGYLYQQTRKFDLNLNIDDFEFYPYLSAKSFLFNGDGSFAVQGGLLVGGASSTTADAFINFTDGSTAGLSIATEARLRYNDGATRFEQSINGGAWAAFGGGTIGGSGTAGTLPKFTAATTLGDSQVQDTGTVIKIVSPGDADTEFQTVNGASLNIKSISEEVTVAAAAFTDSASNLLPATAFIVCVAYRVTVVIPGPATTFDVGIAGDTDRYGTGISVGATTVSSSFKKAIPLNPSMQITAGTIRITPDAVPGAATGKVRITTYYINCVEPTS